MYFISLFILAFIFQIILIINRLPLLISKVQSSLQQEIRLDIVLLSISELFLVIIFLYSLACILLPLSKIREGLDAISRGSSPNRLKIGLNGEMGKIAHTVNNIAENLEESYNQLETQMDELYERNWELQKSNKELGEYIDKLNQAEQKYSYLVKNMPEIVCVIDIKGVVFFVNYTVMVLLGYNESEILGKNIKDIDIIKEKDNIDFDMYLETLKEQSSIMTEFRLVRKDGSSIIAETNLTSYVVNGEFAGVQAIVRDVTAKKEMEEEIEKNNRDIKMLYSFSKLITSTLDLNGLCGILAKHLTEAMNFQAAAVHLLDRTGLCLEARALSGFFRAERNLPGLKTYRTGYDSQFDTIERNQILRTNDITSAWFVSKSNIKRLKGLDINEILFIPVSVKNKKLGVMTLCSPRILTSGEINLIDAVVNNAAVAMENALLYENSTKYFIRTIDALVAAVEAKDSYTEGHSQRVSKYAVMIATQMDLTREQIDDIRIAGILHDVGKIGISDNILTKPGRLSDIEYGEIRQHPAISNKILYPVGFSERTLKAIAFHHERYDGNGYPYGLKGDGITIEAQVIAVADAFDAMTSSRSYRSAMRKQDAIEEIVINRSSQFMDSVVDAFLQICDSIAVS
ncbi:MAG TPA: HD domain-containing phosphohydrolase [Clostridia bacterium]